MSSSEFSWGFSFRDLQEQLAEAREMIAALKRQNLTTTALPVFSERSAASSPLPDLVP